MVSILVTGALAVLGTLMVFVVYLTLAVNAEASHNDRVLSVPFAGEDLEGFLRAVQGASAQTVTEGNSATVYQNGDAIFPPMLAAIAAARETIHLATYIYWNGGIPHVFTEALAEAAQRGVVVRIVLDSEGAEFIPKTMVQRMSDAGCTVAWFRRAQWFNWFRYNRRSHRRLLVVDGIVGFTGGVGIADEWSGNGDSPKHWRDTHVRLEGPVVASLQAGFADNWNQCTRELLLAGRDYPVLPDAGTLRVAPVMSTPANGASAAQRTYAACIAGASRTLHITNAYFVPTPAFVEALCTARRRGVDVTVIVPGPYHDQPVVRRASRHTWAALLASGVVIHEFQPTMIHAKTMIVDDVLQLVGSINFDPRSFALNSEFAVLLVDEGIAKDAETVFAADLAGSRRVTEADVAARGFANRAIDGLFYWLRAQL
jgi:cardiolipin synthase